ncbi:PRC-barrel domain-containing protein [Nodosilinea sp. LEGE 07088]|uniref:PRC-barrel domain-containing protein n=1 Tax=Nodosilinea sp. LEGE 07088 TaxID=2777968 RepID=UPI0018823321|nr:PRC-barrel domain-containing protein [Nodosilinea sp. LEGE 07088]MBE9141405.1 PRC-barrel domain-containing protein [Nodosilinea sp. LEGE 07088]
MKESYSLVRQSELLNRLVLDYKTAGDLGKVGEVWLDPHLHTVRGLTSQSGFWKAKARAFTWDSIKAIGEDSIMVISEGADPAPKKPETVKSVIGHELWTGSGSRAGHIVDCLIDSETGKVVYYLFRSDGWSGLMEGIYALQPSAISSIGNKRLIAEDEAVRQSEKYAEGLEEKLHAAQDFLKRDVEKTKEEWEVAQQKGRAIAEQVQEKTQVVTEQLKDKFVQAKSSEEAADLSDNGAESSPADEPKPSSV